MSTLDELAQPDGRQEPPLRRAGSRAHHPARVIPVCRAITAAVCLLLALIPALITASPAAAAQADSPRASALGSGSDARGSSRLSVGDGRHADWADAIIYFVIVDRFAASGGELQEAESRQDSQKADDKAEAGTNNKSNEAKADTTGLGETEADIELEADENVDVSAPTAAPGRPPGTFHGGNLEGLRQQLDEIAQLGVTAIWITPVVRNTPGFVTGAGFPDWAYHGYWADDFESIDPRFGTEDDLRNLAQACHERGIALLLDVVYNHVGYDSQYLDNPETRGWLRTGDACGDDDITSCVAGLPDLRTELPEVAEHLMNAHIGLAARTGIDGFRLDTVKHVGHELWSAQRALIRKQLGHGFFLLGEVWGGDYRVLDPWFERDEMDAGFDFSFAGNVFAWLQGRGRTVAFNRYLERRHEVREGYHLAHYLSSHDVPTALHILEGDTISFRLATLLQMTTIGIPVLYYGEEVGRRGGDWPENRSDMPWGDRAIEPGAGLERDEALREDVRRLIMIRRDHPALSRGSHTALSYEGDLLVLARQHEPSRDRVVVAINRGNEAAEAAISTQDLVTELWSDAPLHDIWNDEPIEVDPQQVIVRVGPRSARVIVAGSP